MKIVVLDGYTLNPGDISWQPIEVLGEVTIYDRTPSGRVVERIGNAEAVFTNKTVLTREQLQQCPNVKFVGVLATGYNVVDVAAATELGIVVCNIPAYGTMAVAQLAAALLLELCHRVGAHSDSVRAGEWEKSSDFCYWHHPLIELNGKTLGIVGFGRIGQAFAKIGQAFGMNILAYAAHRDPSLESETCRYADLDELYGRSDVISLHCPLLESNKGMINKASIARMKTGVLIINTSRGPLVAEQDLADALASGKVAGAGLDVLSTEPPQPGNPLIGAKNCIVTPHIAWAPREARTRLLSIAANNLSRFLEGNPQNVVNR